MANMQREIIIIPATKSTIFSSYNDFRQLRVASYSRVSTDFEEQLRSFHAQKEYYTDLILKHPKWQLVGTFADEGISGASVNNRPDFQRMIKKCEKGKIDLIITKSISRFSRNTRDTLGYIRKLKSIGVGVIFEKEGLNTAEESSEVFLTILSALAQEELCSLSKNVAQGHKMKRERGEYIFQYTKMIGYCKGADGTPQVIPEQAEIIQKIYRLYLMGKSQKNIADHLNECNIPASTKNTKWSAPTIASILSNEKYCGDILMCKTYVESHLTKKVKKNNGERPQVYIKNNHEAIVSREVFQKVQEERARRNSKPKISDNTITNRGKYSGKYALAELLICGECGTPYRRKTWKIHDDSLQYVWRCIARLDHGNRYCKHSPSLKEKSLHQSIVNAIKSTTGQRGKLIPILGQHIEKALWQASSGTVNMEEMEQRIELLKNETMAIITASVAGDTMAENEDKLRAINEEITQLHNQVLQLKEQSTTKADIAQTLHDYTEFLELDTTDCEVYSDTLVRQLIHTIKVGEDVLTIYFKSGAVWTQPMEPKVRKNHRK